MKRYDDIEIMQPVVATYLEELRHVAKNLNRVNSVERLLSQKLLLSMDDGWGSNEVVKRIRDVLVPYFDVSSDAIDIKIMDIAPDKEVSYWMRKSYLVEELDKRAVSLNAFSILVIDMTKRLDDLYNPQFLEALEYFASLCKNVIFIIQVPCLDKKDVARMEEIISKKVAIRTLHVPAPEIEKQVDYLEGLLREREIIIADGGKELLAQWIWQKQKTGFITGLDSLSILQDELMYQKALNGKDEESWRYDLDILTPEDIEPLLKIDVEAEKEDAYELLNNLIGMAQLKLKVREIVAQIKLQKELAAQGRNIEKPSMHMMFLGNPGTGKTTVARIIGQIFKQEGLLSKGDFSEVTGNYFVEGLVSDSTKKVRDSLKKARGSVLFVDEAYGMNVGHSNGNCGDHIVPAFVAEMENQREDMCIIFAGYEDEMDAFVKLNSGLKSRIPHILHFPNYSREELQEIFFKMTEGAFEYEEELKETLEEYLFQISDETYEKKEFSNGRFVRNLYERTWGKAAYRINFSEDKEIILRAEDMKEALTEEAFAKMLEEKTSKRIRFM